MDADERLANVHKTMRRTAKNIASIRKGETISWDGVKQVLSALEKLNNETADYLKEIRGSIENAHAALRESRE